MAEGKKCKDEVTARAQLQLNPTRWLWGGTDTTWVFPSWSKGASPLSSMVTSHWLWVPRLVKSGVREIV